MSSCLFLFVSESSSEHRKGEWSPEVTFLSLSLHSSLRIFFVLQLGVSSGERDKIKRKTVGNIFYRENVKTYLQNDTQVYIPENTCQ